MRLADLEHCFGGVVPPALTTADARGMPNIVRLSSVRVYDDTHVVLTRQFFGKTVANLAVNPQAALMVVDPYTFDGHVLDVRFVRSETSGPAFEMLKAEVDAIASLMGVTDVFSLQSADVFEVLAIGSGSIGRGPASGT